MSTRSRGQFVCSSSWEFDLLSDFGQNKSVCCMGRRDEAAVSRGNLPLFFSRSNRCEHFLALHVAGRG